MTSETPVGEERLALYLVDALQPDERALVEAHLDASPDGLARLAAVARRLGVPLPGADAAPGPSDALQRLRALTAPRPTSHRASPQLGWRLPPPTTTRGIEAVRPLHLGATVERVELRFRPPASDPDLTLVVLRREAEGWVPLLPTPTVHRTLGDLRTTEDGARILDVPAPAEGLQRWAIALAPATLSVDWEAPEADRWSALQAAILRRAVWSTTVDVPAA